MKKYIFILCLPLLTLTGCDDAGFLVRQPTNIINEDDTWKNETLIKSLIADLYNRYVDYQQLETWYEFCNFDEGYAATAVDRTRHQNATYGYGTMAIWNYTYIRHLNLFIEKCTNVADGVIVDSGESRERFIAEARFLRAAYYFELAKRMGGVPLITESLEYDYSGDATYLRHPRAKESDIYDFVIKECEDIKTILPNRVAVKDRATKAAALAMESRAALYAASIAKYGATTPAVKTDGWEVGIPAEKADDYYRTALAAAKEIDTDKVYGLYENDSDKTENFVSLFLDKGASNNEAIFVKNYSSPSRIHWFTVYSLPASQKVDYYNASLNGSLNLAQQFELVQGNRIAPFETGTMDNPVFYDNVDDIFAGRDPRLAATFMLPGSMFAGKPLDIWAGYVQLDGSIITSTTPGGAGTLPNGEVTTVVGTDGPCTPAEYNAHTGFYVRKYVDPSSGAGDRNVRSDVWFIRYRFAEVLLNAAEASFELGQVKDAAEYLNRVRRRAGFTTDLKESEIDFDRIVHERRVELAYEGHHIFDMKRWRLAHVAWDGLSMNDQLSDPAVASARNTQILGLWPLKVYAPGAAQVDGKWVYVVQKPSHVTASHQFRMGNYYSQIGNDILTNNPQLVKQPNQ